jgi:hypothetical protein
MQPLKEGVAMRQTWQKMGNDNEQIRMNFLLYGDKGYTIPQMFEMLEESNLEWVGMVNWRQWTLEDLFNNAQPLPEYVDLLISQASALQRLHLYELLHPVHRLLDFWCGHQNREVINKPFNLAAVNHNDRATWQTITFHLHPQLRTENFKRALEQSLSQSLPFPLTQFLSCTASQPINLTAPDTICLWILWQQPCYVDEIVSYWLKIKPLNPLTLDTVSESTAYLEVYQALLKLESLLVILIS